MVKTILGISSHIEQYGQKGEPILLLHGWGKAVNLKQHLEPLALVLADEYRVTALEFPAHGQSGKPNAAWGVPEFALWVKAAMDALELRGVTLVAHSFGGRVALWLCTHYPKLVRRVVLTGAAGLLREKTPEEEAAGSRYQARKKMLQAMCKLPLLSRSAQTLQKKLRDRRSSSDYLEADEDMKDSFVRIVSQDLGPLLPQVSQPTLLIWGDQDEATPLWMAQRMEQEIPDAGLVIFENRGHFAYLEELGRFAGIIKAFIREDRKTVD